MHDPRPDVPVVGDEQAFGGWGNAGQGATLGSWWQHTGWAPGHAVATQRRLSRMQQDAPIPPHTPERGVQVHVRHNDQAFCLGPRHGGGFSVPTWWDQLVGNALHWDRSWRIWPMRMRRGTGQGRSVHE